MELKVRYFISLEDIRIGFDKLEVPQMYPLLLPYRAFLNVLLLSLITICFP